MENTLSELNKGVNEPSENNIAAIEPEHSEDLGEKRIPAWPLATRGCPDPILRSELFGVVAKGKRVHFRNHVIKSWKGTSIIFSGEQLDQNDLDLWLEILHLASNQPISNFIIFSARSMLRTLGTASISGKDIKRLRENIERLKLANLKIKTPEWSFMASLIDSVAMVEAGPEKGQIAIKVNPQIASMFCANTWTQIELVHRRSLKTQLAQWIHGFYMTHRNPKPMNITLIHDLSGSKAEPYRFKQMLCDAILELAVLRWEIRIADNLVDVKRPKYQYEKSTQNIVAQESSPPLPPPALAQTEYCEVSLPLLDQKIESAEFSRHDQEEEKFKKLPAWKQAEIMRARAQRAKVAL